MNNVLTEQADAGYRLAEQKASQYFTSLRQQLMDNTYTTALTQDIHVWQKKHIHRFAWLSLLSPSKRKPDPRDVHRYIHWLNTTGKLDDYLDRSISYIYMRDLGQALDSPDTQARIQHIVQNTKNTLWALPLGAKDSPIISVWLRCTDGDRRSTLKQLSSG